MRLRPRRGRQRRLFDSRRVSDVHGHVYGFAPRYGSSPRTLRPSQSGVDASAWARPKLGAAPSQPRLLLQSARGRGRAALHAARQDGLSIQHVAQSTEQRQDPHFPTGTGFHTQRLTRGMELHLGAQTVFLKSICEGDVTHLS